jgi:hypothetical protein
MTALSWRVLVAPRGVKTAYHVMFAFSDARKDDRWLYRTTAWMFVFVGGGLINSAVAGGRAYRGTKPVDVLGKQHLPEYYLWRW